MIKFFVDRPVTTLMFVLFWVILGAWSLPKMNVERAPAMDFPMVSATLIYPGANPLEVEEQVLKPIENAIAEVSQIKRLSSQAFESGGFVMVEFTMESDINHKLLEVKDKVEAIVSSLPAELKKPRIEKLNVMTESVVDMVIFDSGQGGDEFLKKAFTYSEEVLANKLTSIAGVASAKVAGGRERAIRIDLNPVLMMSRGIGISDITGALSQSNLNFPGGRIEYGAGSMSVRFVGEFATVQDIANLSITTSEGGRFRLKDVASVSDSSRKQESGARMDGTDMVMISIVKASDGNAVKISKAVNKNIKKYTDALRAELGESARLKIVSDSAVAITNETNSTVNGILLGMILTIAVLLAFTRNWRTTIIACAVIPASLVAGFFFMNASGFTINSFTMLAMATALGSLIFNAIIIIESALMLMGEGTPPAEAAVRGTGRVAAAVLAGAGTNMAVFTPLAMMDGIAGMFMSQFGMTVVYLTLLSIMFSFSLTPMMISLLLRVKKEKKKKDPTEKEAEGLFKKIFEFQFRRPMATIGAAFGILILSMGLLPFVGNEFKPETDVSEITVIAAAPRGATYAKSLEIAEEIESKLSQFPEVISTATQIGQRGVENITVVATLKPLGQRSISDKLLAQRIVPKMAGIVDADIQVKAGKIQGFAADITINIYGDNDEIREGYAARAIHALNNIPEIQSARLSATNPGYEFRFIPNEKTMSFYGINNVQAASVLRAALYGNDTYKFRDSGEEVPIIVSVADEFVNPDMFENITVKTVKGLVPLSELGEIKRAPASPNIYRRDKSRVSEIQVIIGKSTMGPVQNKITAELDRFDFSPGYGFYYAGMSEIQAETTGEMAGAFLLAVILTYMLLAAIMNSMLHPFTIATGILTSFSGVFIMMFLSGASLNIAAMLSIIMLVGLAVNNNIIVLEPAVAEIRKGGDMKKVLWKIYNERSRMIIMTSVAVMAGMVPQLWSAEGMKSSMGAVIVGGMLAALVFAFVLTPALFVAMEKLRSKAFDFLSKTRLR
ncbi:MAG: efflux RND transporter permease subunit [Rickettsiales bacterium]|jgi:HAE1 family hydrophobic/amphiphilic exporter-1|nr:efflux RND transporter permease subunit [Rickettsiales bacterium]